MSEYYFARESTAMPMYVVAEEFEEGAPSTRFTYPSHAIPIFPKYKPSTKYEIPELIFRPEFSVARKLYDSIDLNNIYGVNWIPIRLMDNGQHDFMMLQVANEIDVIDHKNSDFKRIEDDMISGMKSLVLDIEKIASIPLYKRLIFIDKFWGFHTFYHKKIVDKVLSLNPSGIRFIPVREFNESWVG